MSQSLKHVSPLRGSAEKTVTVQTKDTSWTISSFTCLQLKHAQNIFHNSFSLGGYWKWCRVYLKIKGFFWHTMSTGYLGSCVDTVVVLKPVLKHDTALQYWLAIPEAVNYIWVPIATGAFQSFLADQSGHVWDTTIHTSARYIKFLYNVQFAARDCFPNVIGSIDCTGIAVNAQSENKTFYVNWKHVHSINTQNICDAQR